ncbi:hypothetical protein [Thauera sp.]|uniref:hypothetical protein n=1 Tax=Thauera sp. TaxID=1905334 RepID=UPI0039E38EAD
MTITWGFFNDPALTSPQTEGVTIAATLGPVDRVIYFGSPVSGKTLQASSSPGASAITIAPIDATPATGAAASQVKLALSAAGLDSAVGGASVDVGLALASGAANALAIYVRTVQGGLPIGLHADLSLATNPVVES